MLTSRTDRMIDELIDATYGARADARIRYRFAHALQGLVRLARWEQLQEIRRDTESAAGQVSAAGARDEMERLLRKVGMQLPERPGMTDPGRAA